MAWSQAGWELSRGAKTGRLSEIGEIRMQIHRIKALQGKVYQSTRRKIWNISRGPPWGLEKKYSDHDASSISRKARPGTVWRDSVAGSPEVAERQQ